MPIYKICNVGANRYLNINGSDFMGTALTSNIYSVNIWPNSNTPEQNWYLPILSSATTYIRSYMNNNAGLNIRTTDDNCTIHMIPGNENDAQIELIQTATAGCYKIRLKNYPAKYLTAEKNAEGAKVIWGAASTSNLQVWKFIQQTIVESSTVIDCVYANNGTMSTSAANYNNYTDKMNKNAKYVYDFFRGKNCSKAATCAILGNMEVESTMNPGIWRAQYNLTKEYGIAQCKPASDFINWCFRIALIEREDYTLINNLAAGKPKTLMDAELTYILWECEVLGGVFYPGAKGTLLNIKTFDQFKKVETSPDKDLDTLSDIFCSYFERPDTPNYSKRQEKATKWYNTF